MAKYKKSLFLFRRDLRLEDNSALIYALAHSDEVISAFIFTPEQIDKNPYRSDHCLQFMIESLEVLQELLEKKGGRLYLFYGEPEKVVEECIVKLKVDAVFANRDYTPYSRKRDEKIGKVAEKKGIVFSLFNDALLQPPEETMKADGKPYTIFTPFFRNSSRLEVARPISNKKTNYFSKEIPFANASLKAIFPKRSDSLFLRGGREEALSILKRLKDFKSYLKERDFPALDGTTHLSAYLKFTVVSPREVYWAIVDQLGSHSDLLRELYWRDFFSSIAFFFPHVFEGAFHKKYDALEWENSKSIFQKWCEGKTGFPIVDAGMRQMNETGYMHNRVRMIAASFLVKDLHIDWRWGEKYFAKTLIDYDPAVNNGNWQWAASTGCDAQPYFRIFNPWNQQKKFDPECDYIKKWIPELKEGSSKMIHDWENAKDRTFDYPAPIVDHGKEAKKALSAYKAVS